MSEIEHSVSGFKLTGSWSDIVEHGEKITAALRYFNESDTDDFQDWNEWRPKSSENLDDEICEKTSQKASIQESKGERKGETPTDDFNKAGEKLEEAYETLGEDDTEAVDKAADTISYATRAIGTVSRKTLRTIEEGVYENLMTALAPYYFDNTLVSANISENGGPLRKKTEYTFEVNINNDELKESVGDLLIDFEESDEDWRTIVQEEGESSKIPALPA